jgi:uncharacterized protein
MSPDSKVPAEHAATLIAKIRSYGPVAVAFSGGVDSAVVARAAVEAWGTQAVAVTAVSPSLAAVELQTARTEAALIGIRHVEIATEEFSRPEYRRNHQDRCFFCKDTLYSLTHTRLSELQVQCIVNGANADDLGDHRPGMKAAADHDVRSPLIELNMDKESVRSLARFWNLTVADKPAAPCLASRIAYGVEVTEERVGRIEQAEAVIREIMGLNELRVRCEANELARIEVPLSDLEGFRSGNLNHGVPLVQLGSPRQ